MLEVSDLRIAYGRVVAVHGLDLRVDEGEIVAIVGPNGAGKTSTMMAISGVVAPEAGRIRFRGEDISLVPSHDIYRRGHRPGARGPVDLLGADGQGQSSAGSPRSRCGREGQSGSRGGLRAVSGAARTPSPARRHPERRAASDAGDRPRPHGTAEAVHAGRAFPGPRPSGGRGGLRPHHQSQPTRHDDSCWSSRTCARRSRFPTVPTCSKRAGSSKAARRPICSRAI